MRSSKNSKKGLKRNRSYDNFQKNPKPPKIKNCNVILERTPIDNPKIAQKNSRKGLKRGRSTVSDPNYESYQNKFPKLGNLKVVLEKVSIEDSKIPDVSLQKRIDNLEKRMEKYEESQNDMQNIIASNQKIIDGIYSKFQKIKTLQNRIATFQDLTDKSARNGQHYYPYYGNMLIGESFFDTEGLMTIYGMTGENITLKIMSYLDYETLVTARMVSKTWYRFLDDHHSLWIDLMRKSLKKILKMRRWPEIYDKWVQLIDLILANGKVADLITILEPLIKVPGYWDWNWFRELPIQIVTTCLFDFDWTKLKTDKKSVRKQMKYLKILKKFDFVEGLDEDAFYNGHIHKKYYAKGLLFWSLTDMKTFRFVLSLVQENTQLQLETYSSFFDPVWGAIREEEMGLTKLTCLIPFTTKKFWNSGRWISSVEVDHTPLADAIMVGDIGMVKAIMPLTRITANPKARFGSYLHLAVKFGRFYIFKLIFDELKRKKYDWLKLKDSNSHSAYEYAKQKDFRMEDYDKESGKPYKIRKEKSDIYREAMITYIYSMMN